MSVDKSKERHGLDPWEGFRAEKSLHSTAWQRFRGQKRAVAGLALVGALFIVAALAPFLAGNRPILFVGEDGLELPVFKAFTQEDFFWFACPAAALVLLLFKKAVTERKQFLLLSAAVLFGTVMAVGLAWPERIVHDDYRPYREGDREARVCLFPLVPYSSSEVPLKGMLEPPSGSHWFGTDRQGDDILARMIHGTRLSLFVGFTAVVVCLLIGVVLGALAGYFGGIVDALVCRLIEVVTCFPAFFALLAVLAFLPPRIFWVMLLIGLVRWPGVARLTRAEFLRLRKREFVVAARAMGFSNRRIIFRHILPNSLTPIIVAATFGMAGAIMIESGLSFLGIGGFESWGRLLSEYRPYFDVAWWLTVFPGVAIFVTVTAFNLVGEGLRDALDPRLKE